VEQGAGDFGSAIRNRFNPAGKRTKRPTVSRDDDPALSTGAWYRVGKRHSRSPLKRAVQTQQLGICAQYHRYIYHEITSTSGTLLLYSLLFHQPPLSDIEGPPLSSWDISVATISGDKGRDNHTKASGNGRTILSKNNNTGNVVRCFFGF